MDTLIPLSLKSYVEFQVLDLAPFSQIPVEINKLLNSFAVKRNLASLNYYIQRVGPVADSGCLSSSSPGSLPSLGLSYPLYSENVHPSSGHVRPT